MSSAARRLDPYQEGLVLSRDGRHAEAIEKFERALALRPDDARVLFALGNTARALDLGAAAEAFFRRVLAIEPDRIEALVNLANLLRANGDTRAARALLEPVLGRYQDLPELWLTLGSVLREQGDHAEAERHYRAALGCDAGCVPALANLADLRADAGADEEALALYNRALARDPKNAQARLNRSVLHLLRGRLKEGWRDYAARLRIADKAPVRDHGLPSWSGESLKRKRLVVTAEQGVGDQMMFASLVPALLDRAEREGGSIVLECEPRLVPLFARSFPRAAVAASRMEQRGGVTYAHYDWLKHQGGANLATEIGTLPRYLASDLAQLPKPHAYLRADADEVARWRNAFGARPAIGICWRSGKLTQGRALQYAPLELWAHLLAELQGTIVSAQYDATPGEVMRLQALSGCEILVPGALDQKNDLDGTSAMLSALDIVISAPTAVSWLAAGAGVPTLKVLYDSSWTSFGADHEPLAPACRCIMPAMRGDWSDVFEQTARAVEAIGG
jgi:tetratricopeptide (TPR) repeat protein